MKKTSTKKYKTVDGVRVYPAPEPKRIQNKFAERTEKMFEDLFCVMLPSRTEIFIESLHEGYQKYGELTDAQFISLERNWNKYMNGIPFFVEGANYHG